MKRLLGRLVREEEAQDLIEYAMLAALISLAAIATMRLVGPQLIIKFNAIVAGLS